MANKSKRGGNKNKIIGICCGIGVVVLLVVAIVAAVMANTGYNDAYFVSDDTKYVLTIDNTEEAEAEEDADAIVPTKIHYVYYYSGDDITDVKLFAEFADADTAQRAYDELMNSGEDIESSYKSVETDGKYLIQTFVESAYGDMTAADAKAQVELMNNINEAGDDEDAEGTEETTEETTEGTETTE